MKQKTENTEYDPYCPVCGSCGEVGCCSPISCQQSSEGYYCKGYLDSLKFGYAMNKFFENEIWDKMTEDLKAKYDKMWDEKFDHYYK